MANLPNENSISKAVYDAGQKLADSSGSLPDKLNQTLSQLLTWPFLVKSGFVRDTEGEKAGLFGAVIYTTASQIQPIQESADFDADNVACVIDVDECLNMEILRAAYERIAYAKRLKKTPLPKVPGAILTNVTLGIIFARDSGVPIDSLAEELDRLNRTHPDREWTDMVVVLSKGVINYGVHFPGENILSDFLPPTEDAFAHYTPAIYVVLTVRPTGVFTFNKMCSFIMAHLMLFFSGTNLPKWRQILEGTPKMGIPIIGYQYNLSNKLIPVPRQFYDDRYISPRPFLIEGQNGKLLSTLQFLPWQDGGVILLKGKLPLEGLLIFLGKKGLRRSGVVNLTGGQISYVLPITQADFSKMLHEIQRRSNMAVRPYQEKFIFQKIMDEGSRTPFIARIYSGIFRLRDNVFQDDAKRNIFDKPYEQVLEPLLSTRDASQKITQLLSDHFHELANGEIVQSRGQAINIEKTIDNELRKEVGTFLNCAVRTLKLGMQNLTKALGKDIGVLFVNQKNFKDRIRVLEKNDPNLAGYLRETRKWSERLINSRNDLEHNGWILPGVSYIEVSGLIRANEPKISDRKVSDFVKLITDRLICFVEEVTVHCLVKKMPAAINVTEIPLLQRDPVYPLRFQVTLTNGGMPIWNIAYHQSSFEET